MQLIPKFVKLGFAMLPIGDTFTMGIEEAIMASQFIECDKIIGMHYDTFDPIKIDHDDAQKKFSEAGKDLVLLNIGDTISI